MAGGNSSWLGHETRPSGASSSFAAVPAGRWRAHSEKGWIALDQVASSVTNFGSAALLAGLLNADDFGATSIAFAVYVLAAGVGRAWCAEPLLLLSSHLAPAKQRSSTRSAVGFATVVGGAAGIVCIGSIAVLEGPTRIAIVVLGFCLPGLLAHDTIRTALVMTGRSRLALESDLVWLAFSLAGLMVLRRLDEQSIVLGLLSWSGSGVLAAAYALARFGAMPRYNAATWARRSARVGASTSLEFGILQLTSSMNLVLLTAVTANLALTGAFRGAQVILGPTAMCVAAVSLYARPAMIRAHHGHGSLGRLTVASTAVCLAVFVGWTAVVLVTPRSVGIRVFGATWDGAIDLVPIVSVIFLALAVTAMPVDAIRSAGRLDLVLRVRVGIAALVIAGTLLGARLLAERGAITGFAFASLAGSSVAWWTLRTHVGLARREEDG